MKAFQLFSRRSAGAVREGLMYVSHDEAGPSRLAAPGVVVKGLGRAPPWIVVNRDAASIVVARWPGRLWKVRVIDAATEAEQTAHGGAPRESAGYLRAISVKVIAEEPVEQLFGPHGGAVRRVIDTATELARHEAEALASARHSGATAAVDRLWRAWMKERHIPEDEYPDILDGTLLLGTFGSPVNRGLTILYNVAFRRAKQVDGEVAIRSNDEEVWLAEPWQQACIVLLDAALAFGAPTFVDVKDREALLAGWLSVYA